ncbi:hypothetical protein EJP67_01095 [Variovorax guangxiensis]|uniref:Uncharacterized protein n=1 Tax=Variovorax guangxiensis TaxID=1775474 RepID=A0A3S0XBN7_9BURK|nr:hypothetical protein [Variovorax guangxiensis]RUR65647.1 hypothetical protein EJP67_01095 [Variovorax guangxiensis]
MGYGESIMDGARLALSVPDGWTGWLELMRTPSGTYAGIAELSFSGVPRCALVITQQLSWDAAVERATLRAEHFVRQWGPARNS